MQCPKCNTKMSHEEGVISRESTLNGQRGGIEPVSGHRCWNCGKWVCDALEVEKPMPPKIEGPPSREPRFTETDAIVFKYRQSVLRMWSEDVAMTSIAKMLKLASPGARCRPQSVQYSITRLKMGALDGIQNAGI